MNGHKVLIGTDDVKVPIKPKDIDLKRVRLCFPDKTDNQDIAYTAAWLVRFFQERDKGWNPFSRKEAEGFYKKYPEEHEVGHAFDLNALVSEQAENISDLPPIWNNDPRKKINCDSKLIILGTDGLCHMTTLFVADCFSSERCPVSGNTHKET